MPNRKSDKTKYQNPPAKGLNFKNGVFMMPSETFRHARWKALSSSAKVTYIAILTAFKRSSNKNNGHKNPDNEVEITQEQIEGLTGLSHTTVVSAITELRGYRRSEEVKATKKSKNRVWKFEKTIADSRCFLFIKKQGGLEKNTTKYSLNGYYLNSQEQIVEE